jgi:hypothetical protein
LAPTLDKLADIGPLPDDIIDAFFDLADAIITVRSLIGKSPIFAPASASRKGYWG